MAVWNDPHRWEALCSGAECPIGLRGDPQNVVAELEASWVTASEAGPVKGYVCLVAKTHAVELHHLPEAEALPHLHMHFFPRYRGDQFEGRPIDPKQAAQPVYVAGGFLLFRAEFLRALRKQGEHTLN